MKLKIHGCYMGTETCPGRENSSNQDYQDPEQTIVRQDLDVLHSQLNQLQQTAGHLSRDLADAAAGLRDEGMPPGERLLVKLEEFQQRFRQLGLSLTRGAGTEGADGQLSAVPNRLADLGELLNHRVVRHRALSRLDALRLIEHVDSEPFQPLEECQQEARLLMERIREAKTLDEIPEAAEVESGTHPFIALVRLVTDEGGLEDDDWTRCHEVVQEQFGRTMAVAAARGKLQIPGGFDLAAVDRGGDHMADTLATAEAAGDDQRA